MAQPRKTTSEDPTPDETKPSAEEGSAATTPTTPDGAGASPGSSAPSLFPPEETDPDPGHAAVKVQFVRYATNGVTYDLKLAANGDLLYPETGAVAVTGAKQQSEGDPAEGHWVPLN